MTIIPPRPRRSRDSRGIFASDEEFTVFATAFSDANLATISLQAVMLKRLHFLANLYFAS